MMTFGSFTYVGRSLFGVRCHQCRSAVTAGAGTVLVITIGLFDFAAARFATARLRRVDVLDFLVVDLAISVIIIA
jgi:hypothetical protein